jgi:hypothetical protein
VVISKRNQPIALSLRNELIALIEQDGESFVG